MKKRTSTLLSKLIAFTFFPLAAFAATNIDSLPLMPFPQKITQNDINAQLILTSNIEINSNDPLLTDNIREWKTRIERQTGWFLHHDDDIAPIFIHISIKSPNIKYPTLGQSERYNLTISSNKIDIDADTRFGAMYGMETLLQLIHNDDKNTVLPQIAIEDFPRFAWRGLLLDSARHFIPFNDIKRQIDGLASAKMNVFHWHLTDDQGWRFESKYYPKLQALASDGLYYTQTQMKELVEYAAQKGIRVVPEIDLPGHASSIAVAYPNLIAIPENNLQPERYWGVHKPTLDPTNDAVYQFVDTIIAELAAIFPDEYIHIGGDEVDPTQWNSAPHIQKFMKHHHIASVHDLQTFFNTKLDAILKKHHKNMIGWDEIFQPDLPKTIVVQSWRGQDSLGATAQQNYQGLLSTGFYLDQPQYTSYHYRNELYPKPFPDELNQFNTENAMNWSFSMPRLKGAPVNGSFTLIKEDGSDHWRGFIDFEGRSRRVAENIDWINDNDVSLQTDTWMGPTQLVVTFNKNTLSGYALIGNTRYPLTGAALTETPNGIAPVELAKDKQHYILGGEAALWAENISPAILDIRIWPRTYAIAERLWSNAALTDENKMYSRLQAVDAWSTISVNLKQQTQLTAQLMRLAQSTHIEPLQILIETVEPAHYYTRNHLKSQAGNYHQYEPLNRLVDALPVESFAAREFHQLVDQFINNKHDNASKTALLTQLTRWKNNIENVSPIIKSNYQLTALIPLIEHLNALLSAGMMLLENNTTQKPLSNEQYLFIKEAITNASKTVDEIVIPLVSPIETLFNAIAIAN